MSSLSLSSSFSLTVFLTRQLESTLDSSKWDNLNSFFFSFWESIVFSIGRYCQFSQNESELDFFSNDGSFIYRIWPIASVQGEILQLRLKLDNIKPLPSSGEILRVQFVLMGRKWSVTQKAFRFNAITFIGFFSMHSY